MTRCLYLKRGVCPACRAFQSALALSVAAPALWKRGVHGRINCNVRLPR